ncbi:hypothetical protein [Capnocytophaga cynodegmi]|uniref:hypothetical protein n=1 Tax=Capnocytophaga cynodegmi TaxID=28189 RepID=UPI0012DFEA2A|nr:hypothetical protein [Capnocytophaga cynodegmi]
MKQTKSELLTLIIIFFVICMISGSTRINPMLQLLEPEILEGARISAYLSLAFNSIFYIVILILTFYFSSFLTQYSKDEKYFSIFLEASSAFVLSLCIFEVFGVALTFTLFEDSLQNITDIHLITEQIKESIWWKYNRILSLLNVTISSLVFFFFCYNKKLSIKKIFLISIIIFTVNLCLKLF